MREREREEAGNNLHEFVSHQFSLTICFSPLFYHIVERRRNKTTLREREGERVREKVREWKRERERERKRHTHSHSVIDV